jgi:hypothetical protein
MEVPSTRRLRLLRCYVNRDLQATHERLHRYYFTDDCVYPLTYFQWRYRTRGGVFFYALCISETSSYFTKRFDAIGRSGLTPLQKYVVVVRLLAYGMAIDMINEYLKLGRTTTLECLEKYCEGIIDCYGAEFLRRPTIADTQCLIAKAEEREFSGMVGSIDCMHWQWKNYSVSCQGQITRGTSNILSSSLKL